MEKRITCRLYEIDLANLEKVKAMVPTSSDGEAVRYALCEVSSFQMLTVSNTPATLPLSDISKSDKPIDPKREAYLNPPKVRKYSDAKVEEYCSRTIFSKGYCPKCSTEFKQMLCGECACLKSPAGIAELKSWLINQYE